MRWPDTPHYRRGMRLELAAVVGAGLAAWLVPLLGPLPLYFFGALLWMRTRSMYELLAPPATTEWLLVKAARTRAELARSYLADLAVRGAAHALVLGALVAVAPLGAAGERRFDPLPVPDGGPAALLATMLALQLTARAAVGVLRHVGACTWLPQRMRGIANRSTPGPGRHLAFLQDLALGALLFAPVVAALALWAFWLLAPLAALYLALLTAMLRSSEAVHASGNPSLSLREFLGPAAGGSWRPAPSGSATRALLWTGLRPGARAVARAIPSLGLAAGLAAWLGAGDTLDRSALASLLTGALILGSALVATSWIAFASESPFAWQSSDSTAEYLHRGGVDLGRQQRIELAAGALLCLPVIAGAVSVAARSGPFLALLLLPPCSLLLGRCIHGPLRVGRLRYEVRLLAARAFYALVACWFAASALAGEGIVRFFQARPEIVAALVTPFVLAATGLWWRAWRLSTDEDRLKRELQARAPRERADRALA